MKQPSLALLHWARTVFLTSIHIHRYPLCQPFPQSLAGSDFLLPFRLTGYNGPMVIVHVHVRVTLDAVEAFRAATLQNASASVREPGVARFDVIQQQEDPTRFVLVEVYRSAEGAAAHKETPHYATWRDTVAPMMAEPRRAEPLVGLYPGAG